MASEIKRHQSGPILSRAVEYNGIVYLCGLTADDRSQGLKGQTEQVLKKIDALLAASNSDKTRLLSTNIWITDLRSKPEMDAAWQAWIDKANTPARACVEARLGSPDTLVEIMVTAAQR
ncbi:MAG TPA: RidA family protein [Burkholderiales bacterium]|nr:RidA family protein [Burkholderiales bacterium]